MANFDRSGMTQAGINLMGKAIGGATIQFTKLVLGDGEMTGEILDLQGVVSAKQNVDVTRIERNDNQCTVGGELLTSSVKQGFWLREIGLYAIDPDRGEILYNYASSSKPDWIQEGDANVYEELFFKMIAVVGANARVTAMIDEGMVFATRKEVKAESDRITVAEFELNKKRDKITKITRHDLDTSKEDSKIRMVNLGDDVREALAGTAPVYPTLQKGDVAEEHLANQSVTVQKLSFAILGANLFNKDEFLEDTTTNANHGGYWPDSNYRTSLFIPIKPNTTYTIVPYAQHICLYNDDKTTIVNGGLSTANATFTTDSSRAYIQFTYRKSDHSRVMLYEGEYDSTLPYESYGFSLPSQNITEDNTFVGKIIKEEHCSFIEKSINLFNKATITLDKDMNANSGIIYDDTSKFMGDYIPISDGMTYTVGPTCNSMCFHDINKNPLTGKGLYHKYEPTTFTPPLGACYCVISDNKPVIDIMGLFEGDTYYEDKLEYRRVLKGVIVDDNTIGSHHIKEQAIAGKHLDKAAVGSDHIGYKAVTPYHISFIKPTKNLFNTETVMIGITTNANGGGYYEDPNYNTSDFIEVAPETTYFATSRVRHLCPYDANKNVITNSGIHGVQDCSYTTPVNAKYVQITIYKEDMDKFQFEIGEQPTSYEKYIPNIFSEDVKLRPESALFIHQSPNLFDSSNILEYTTTNANGGGYYPDKNYHTSMMIPVKPETTYHASPYIQHICSYNEQEQVMNGKGWYVQDNLTFTTHPGTGFIQISIRVSDLDKFQLVEGSTPLDMVYPYGYYLDETIRIPESSLPPKQYVDNTTWEGLVLSTLGDSITYQATWQPHIVREFGFESYNNYGIGGSRVTGTSETCMNQDARINAIAENSGLIMFMGGTNDWAQNIPLGDFSLKNEDVNTFYGACNVVFKKLQTKFPRVPIIALGTPYGYYPNRVGFPDTEGIFNAQGLMAIDYGTAIGKIARLHGVPFVDVGGESGWSATNVEDYVNFDGAYLHPKAEGGKKMAEVIIRFLKSYKV